MRLHAMLAAVKMLHLFQSMRLTLVFYSEQGGYRGENGANLTLSGTKHTRGWYFVPQGSGLFGRTAGIAATKACLLKREKEGFM